MEIIVVKNYDEMSKKAYEIVKSEINSKPSSCLGLATGSTLLGLYKCLIEGYNKGEISFKDVNTFNLDEYCGLGKGDNQSYVEFMNNNLFKYIDIDISNTHLPDGKGDITEACCSYNKMLKNNIIDIQLLGIGANGHIAFNEPGEPFDLETHKIKLAKKTISDNSRFFSAIEEVPTCAISMGIKNIMSAKSIVLLASGANKAEAIEKAVLGEISTKVPASILKSHNNVKFIIDEAAASKLKY
jgi:glucosamine-6-phosphate deaminase